MSSSGTGISITSSVCRPPAPLTLSALVAVVHPDDRPRVVARLERCARDGAAFDAEFRVVWPDGSIHWLDQKAKAFPGEGGTPVYVTGACADVTARKAVEEALRESEERLRAILGQAAVGIALAALDGRFVDMNRRFSQILGYSVEELEALSFADITHPTTWPPALRRSTICWPATGPTTRSRSGTFARTARRSGV
jgi:PAS domain-containing protein